MALVIAGDRSGVGKTTVTLALLSSLCRRGEKVQSFKVGPDYIDPMFHRYVTNRACRNLDPVLTSETYVQECFARHTQAVNYALVEGVMGLFDGVEGTGNGKLGTGQDSQSPVTFASTAHVARLLDLPILLVLDCSRLSGSVAAIAHGFRSFDPRLKFAGVVLNRVGSDRHLQLLQDALEPLQLPILGILRRQDNISIPDRHLGLVPTAEVSHLDALIDRLAHLGDCFDWERLLPLLQVGTSPQLRPELQTGARGKVRLAVARDRAFSFYYEDNLESLRSLGVELAFWSPLTDDSLPEGIQGMYFGGGFPEVFAQQLAENTVVRDAVRKAILAGMPTYAECGGLMYLCQQIVDFEGNSSPMVGVLPTTAVMRSRLTLGYRQAVVLQDSPLLPAGTTVWGHEFHRSQLTQETAAPLFQARGCDPHSSTTVEGWLLHQLHASYVHLHFAGCPDLPARFLEHCLRFSQVSTDAIAN
jgi:cobyrinic acid a,c-diamide synthase